MMKKKTKQVGSNLETSPLPESATSRTVTPPVRITLAPALTGVKLSVLRQTWFEAKDRLAASGQTIPGNGFAPAFLKLGRAVYVDVPTFMTIWLSKQVGEDGRHE